MRSEISSQWQVHDDLGRRKYLNAVERQCLLAALRELPASLRALCYVLAYTGCRVSEALALTTHHLDADRLTLTIRTLKRRRVVFRTVPVPEFVIAEMQQLQTCPGERFWRIHRSTAWRRVKKVMCAAGIVGPMACCKGLRHSFGMQAARKNVPQSLITRWMGHASPITTAIYLDAVGPEERAFAARMWDG